MTTEEQEIFKRDFKNIVWQKGQVSKCNDWIKRLTAWDKEGSHTKAINEAIERREVEKGKLQEMMRGKTYEDWQKASLRLTKLNVRLKVAEKKVKEMEAEINSLTI